jgi:2-oxoglutarate ferredoxin oxidoreductase subunit alpha
MRLELGGDAIAKLRKVLHYSGLPIDARSITDEILAQEGRMPLGAAEPPLVSAGRAGGE